MLHRLWILHADADNILFIKYEDMKENPKEAVKSVAKFMGHDLTPDVVDSICEQTTFESMQVNNSTNFTWNNKRQKTLSEGYTDFLRKGVVGDWKNHFSEEQSARLDEQYAERMNGTGLDFRFE